MRRFAGIALLAACVVWGVGCSRTQQKDYEARLLPGQAALRKLTDPKEIPDFTQACTNTAGLLESIQNSLNYLKKPSSTRAFPNNSITHEQAVASLEAFKELLGSGLSPAHMNAEIRRRFDVYVSAGCDNQGTVLFTGYYTPVLHGALQQDERFRFPLYKPPADLEKLPDGNPAKPMPARRTIESIGLYQGNELVWLADPFEAFVAHIQGSARVRLPDGKEITVGYAANNGHEYQSIRAELVNDGKIGKWDSLPSMIAYFKRNPADVQKYTSRNPRFVFFSIVPDGRPRGSLNEPVTPLRTIATDKKIFPPGCLAFLSAKLPQRQGAKIVDAPFQGFALDQDTGGAIRAAGRCDVYMGTGDEAGELAGRAQSEGKLYYLFLKQPN